MDPAGELAGLARAADGPADVRSALKLFWSNPSPLMLGISAAIAISARVILGDFSRVDAVVAGTLIVAWPMSEWMIHVFILHFRPKTVFGKTIDLKVAAKHRRHHADPWNLPVVFVPLWVFPLTALAWIAGLLLLAWSPWPVVWGLTALAVYLSLSIHYEWCHFLAHIQWCPNVGYYKRRVKRHRWHHFQHEKLWWGVSTGWGDALMRTGPDAKDAPHSDTVRDIRPGASRRYPGDANDH